MFTSINSIPLKLNMFLILQLYLKCTGLVRGFDSHITMYTRVPQIFPWRSNLLQSLAPTLIKLTYLWFSNDLEDSD